MLLLNAFYNMLNVHCHICIWDKPLFKYPNAKHFITKEQPTFIIQQLFAEVLGTSCIVEVVVPAMHETQLDFRKTFSKQNDESHQHC
jgi:hypothetical protein